MYQPRLHGGGESSLSTSQTPIDRWSKKNKETPPQKEKTGANQLVAVCLSMEAGAVVKRQKVEHSAATALPSSPSELDHPDSLAEELRQAVQDSHAATESLAVEDEQQGQAAAPVPQRVLQVFESSPGACLASERKLTVYQYVGVA
jgi:hypothetical protein